MNNLEKAKEIAENSKQYFYHDEYECGLACALRMAQWKDEQFKEQLSNLKEEIQNNLCASSGFNDEYSQGYQDCGMKVIELIDKILNNEHTRKLQTKD